MTEEKKPVAIERESDPKDAKRPYQKPAIAEEDSYETCATLACGFKSKKACGNNQKNS